MAIQNKNFNKSPDFIKKMFNSISVNYDKLNDIMSFGLHKRIKKEVINAYAVGQECPTYGYGYGYDHDHNLCRNSDFCDAPSPLEKPELEGKELKIARQQKILDLCTGTGDLAGLLAKKFPKAEIIGIDFSSEMLKIAKQKNPNINFIEGDCTQLPFENDSFDLCIISFGLRNIEYIEKALSEIHRVLKKGGIFINLDLGKPNKFFNLFLKPYMYFWVAFLGKIFHGDETPYKYLAESNENFPSPSELIKLYERTGFSEAENTNYLFGQIASQICKKV